MSHKSFKLDADDLFLLKRQTLPSDEANPPQPTDLQLPIYDFFISSCHLYIESTLVNFCRCHRFFHKFNFGNKNLIYFPQIYQRFSPLTSYLLPDSFDIHEINDIFWGASLSQYILKCGQPTFLLVLRESQNEFLTMPLRQSQSTNYSLLVF